MKKLFSLLVLTVFSFHLPAHANDWVRAESAQFIVYSDGSAKQAEASAQELERLDAFLRKYWQREPDTSGSKLEVYLLKDAREVARMAGREDRGVGIAGLYRGQSYGSFFIGNRRQSKFDEVLTGREVLFHEYAHHFFYQNFAIPAPAWFSEGFADYVSSAEVPEKGGWEIGRPLGHRERAILYGGQIPIRDLLTGKDRNDHILSFYAWSWGMTRFLYTAGQGRGSKITQYLTLLNDGVDNVEAAEQAFGDLDAFAREMGDYVRNDRNYRRSSSPLEYDQQVALTELSEADSALVELKLRRLNGANAQQRLEELLKIAGQSGANANSWYELAQTHFEILDAQDIDDLTPVEAALDRALASDPDHMRANVLRGRVLLSRYEDAASGDTGDALIDEAIAHFRRAVAVRPDHPWPVFNLADALRHKDGADEERSALIARAFSLAPESGEIRFNYAAHLASKGEFDEAIRLLAIVANDPHGRGGSAATMIERLESARDRISQQVETTIK